MNLIYKGTPPAHITGVPARDLSNDDISRLAADFNLSPEQLVQQLTARGLYELATKTKSKGKAESESAE